jgi:hypothetical protein
MTKHLSLTLAHLELRISYGNPKSGSYRRFGFLNYCLKKKTPNDYQNWQGFKVFLRS